MMDKVQVLVFAKDGVVQCVQASLGKKDIDVKVIDWDDYAPEYDKDGTSLKEIKKEIAKIRKNFNMKIVWW